MGFLSLPHIFWYRDMEIFLADFQLNCLPPSCRPPGWWSTTPTRRLHLCCIAALVHRLRHNCCTSQCSTFSLFYDFDIVSDPLLCRSLFFFCFIPIIYSYIIKREPQLLQNFKPISGGSKKKFIDDDKKPSKPRMLHHDRQHVDDERREKSIDREEKVHLCKKQNYDDDDDAPMAG